VSTHLHRKHSWARLREAAGKALRDTATVVNQQNEYDALAFRALLLCILGASGVGLALVGLLHLWRGLVG
jgi:hypothetical protein